MLAFLSILYVIWRIATFPFRIVWRLYKHGS